MVRKLLSLSLFLMAMSAALAQQDPISDHGEILASELLGRPVQGARGQPLGEIAGVLFDVRRGGVHYALVAVPEGGPDDRRFAYPVNALRREGRTLALDVPAERLDSLPRERYVPAARVLGGTLEDPLGNRAGTLVDVALDLETGRTRYFLVNFADEENLPLAPYDVRLHTDRPPTVNPDRARRA